ncbi:endolytic transglycosylase MltG [Ketogulonicigenium vulgare]|uniref:Endolytic murein transglycosylase n=1 Tax=Ketogulonicigenium vulgare (strain WSH-001) TaxID=759362 RepID=F9Y451_KETVW|nr:endolytic transglycosylase MltG [Ketogulonicigenium vulgare]ADO42291.1 aminodeoxychorismate lyase [Ketogulonicigenium vulgare Y25]AEM40487.1 Branched-chain alpha-keto acid dehydrogenase E2 subunit [Ketogulonicigenium vulgare WSH-001]ALJ80671.1 branched-chain alpha-keto acid dehydrogenase subunit E2 [Ketogulonicigenium vulgare]ANW33480.1 branched-chain alpha-keto acid dehydrogenase subunit E2 [Ketogulonicigenium vulgare]AOZ54203.1 aminodeoxychorismate lyase [Ketogulonicigenium vulgare]
MWKHLASSFLTFAVVALFLVAGVITWGVREYAAPGPLQQSVCLRVPAGGSFGRAAENLGEQGAISSVTLFNLMADYRDMRSQLKQGAFLIAPGSSMEQITDQITRGGASTCGAQVVYVVSVNDFSARVRELDPETGRYGEVARFNPAAEDAVPAEYTTALAEGDVQLTVQVVEGTTVWQVVNSLNAMDVLEGDVTDLPPEGTLAPDSYEIRRGTAVADLLAQMRTRQDNILQTAWAARADDLPVTTPEEALILASIIEKETGVPDERGEVAAVFVNRLRQGMRLQTDPTVIYGVTEGRGVLGRGLRRSELDTPTPWNTYTIPALPPTPIANPGRASIEAALNPPTSPYIFFVADGTGGHAFATTLDEHNRNVARWRALGN